MNVLDKIKKDILAHIEDMEIDISGLDSCRYESNPYCVDDALVGSSGEYVCDENEEYQAKINKVLSVLEDDDLGDVIDIADGEEVYKDQIVSWLQKLIIN